MYVDYKEVGRRVAMRRKELGLKQSQVNEMVGLSDKYLSNIERATSVMSIDVLMKLCGVLEVTPDYLLLGSEKKKSPEIYEKHIGEAIVGMNEKQLDLLDNFIKWLSQQKIK